MAGDWIKFETATPDKPEVWAIAAALNIDPDAVVGKLLRVWRWFDMHTEDGNAPSVTKMLLDREVNVSGFCDAVELAGWMNDDGTTVSLTHFDRHNGKTAKNRALTAKRVAEHKRKGNEEGNGDGVSGALPKEEKRRDIKKETKKPSPPKKAKAKQSETEPEGFDAFWAAYPKRVAKGPARKAYTNALNLVSADTILAGAKSYANHNVETEDRFIKHPATWLNGECWADGEQVEADPAQVEQDREHRTVQAKRLARVDVSETIARFDPRGWDTASRFVEISKKRGVPIEEINAMAEDIRAEREGGDA